MTMPIVALALHQIRLNQAVSGDGHAARLRQQNGLLLNQVDDTRRVVRRHKIAAIRAGRFIRAGRIIAHQSAVHRAIERTGIMHRAGKFAEAAEAAVLTELLALQRIFLALCRIQRLHQQRFADLQVVHLVALRLDGFERCGAILRHLHALVDFRSEFRADVLDCLLHLNDVHVLPPT